MRIRLTRHLIATPLVLCATAVATAPASAGTSPDRDVIASGRVLDAGGVVDAAQPANRRVTIRRITP